MEIYWAFDRKRKGNNIMFMPNTPQGFGLEIILVAEVGYLWFQSLQNRKTATLSAFFRLCSALMLFLLINIPVRLSDLHLVSWKPGLVFVLNAIFIALETLTAYEWFVYFLTVQRGGALKSRWKSCLISLPLVLMVVLLLASYKTHWLFYADESGTYTRGSLFFLQLLIPYSYIVASFISALHGYRKNKNKRMFRILFSAFLSSLVASVLQVFFSGSFTLAGLSLAVLLVYMEMYQYEIKQIEKMRSLGAVNQKLEAVNEKLNETIRELEISVENEKAANNAKNDFLSRMSHDIRTPLNGILGIIEINDRHPEDVDLLTENRKKAKTAANHLVSLLNDILDMSKLASGKYELSCEPFHISEIMKEVFTISNGAAEKAGITLIAENEGDAIRYPATFGSPLHITRVLLNVVGNAIKYNKKGGSVRVKLAHEYVENDRIRYTVTISDTGIGMSEAYMKTLFEPFSQERIDARSVYEGSGLGMAITKALIDRMDGTIHVESEVGAGSTFVIGLTFAIAPDAETDVETTDEEESLNGLRILLAEDNELNIEIATELLEDTGAAVDVAENGRLALEMFRNHPEGTFDVILMDCMMPLMSGQEATKAIRELDRPDAKTIPIIAMTANAFADDVTKCLEAGMNDHLAKPFEIGKVMKMIRKYVKN